MGGNKPIVLKNENRATISWRNIVYVDKSILMYEHGRPVLVAKVQCGPHGMQVSTPEMLFKESIDEK